jgi:hypothetical protein
MSAIATAPARADVNRGERVSWPRLLWVAPLTIVVAVGVCLALRSLVQALDPSLARTPQLQEPMLTLALEGAVAAVVVFMLFALLVPRPLFWYRIVGAVALVLSWAPDIGLGLGGTPMRLALRYVSPLTSLPIPGLSQAGPPAGGPPPGAQAGGPPPGFFSAMSIEQVLVLMLLHTAVAVVCIVMLTTLTRGATRQSDSITRR